MLEIRFEISAIGYRETPSQSPARQDFNNVEIYRLAIFIASLARVIARKHLVYPPFVVRRYKRTSDARRRSGSWPHSPPVQMRTRCVPYV